MARMSFIRAAVSSGVRSRMALARPTTPSAPAASPLPATTDFPEAEPLALLVESPARPFRPASPSLSRLHDIPTQKAAAVQVVHPNAMRSVVFLFFMGESVSAKRAVAPGLFHARAGMAITYGYSI